MGLKYELQNVISRVSGESKGNLIEAATYHVRKSKEASGGTQAVEFTEDQESKQLIKWIDKSGFWVAAINEKRFIASGFEQWVYLAQDSRYVTKLNASVFYEFWLDYFHSLLIHNFLFPETAYELIGFYREENVLHAVVKQPFVEITEPTDTNSVSEFLFSNGFQQKKNNDYYNAEVGLILEDLHDENVLTNNGVLFFIDTVFYLAPSFFNEIWE